MPAPVAALSRIPRIEPPFDDERPLPPYDGDVQGSLALDYSLRGGLPAAPPIPRQLRLIPGFATTQRTPPPASGPMWRPGPEALRLPRTSEPLPDPHRWTVRLAQAVGEVLTGQRPAQQLLRWTNHAVYTDVSRRSLRRTGGPAAAGAAPRIRVRTARVTRPDDDVVEAAAVVDMAVRVRAMALRLEGHRGRWRCTALTLI